MTRRILRAGFAAGAALLCALGVSNAAPSERANKVFDHWTAERVANAQPRDLVIDHRGLGYLKGVDGQLTPYGHSIRPGLHKLRGKTIKVPNAPGGGKGGGGGGNGGGGGGGGDTTPPTIGTTSPADGAIIGASQTFSAVVTDASGIKTVTFEINLGGQPQSFGGDFVGNDT